MKKTLRILVLGLLVSIVGKQQLQAQFLAEVGQEIGVVAGPVAFFSDYGLRYNLETDVGNSGTGIGIVHYINFAFNAGCNCYNTDTWFSDHFKLRSEADFHYTVFRHYGKWAEKDSPKGEKLRAMRGRSSVFEVGAHLEYHFFSIRDFTAFAYPFSPFISIGGNLVTYSPHATTSLGTLDEDTLFDDWDMEHVITNGETGTTFSVVLGFGSRYKLTASSDLVMNAQWRYYDTDWLDGLNHDLESNRHKDSIFWLNFGYIYYLNF